MWLDVGEDPAEEGHQGKARNTGGLNGEWYVKQVLEGPLLELYTTMNKERDGHIFVVEDGAPVLVGVKSVGTLGTRHPKCVN